MPNKIVAMVCAVAAPFCPHKPKDTPEAKIAADRHPASTRAVARNVILFIGEGMGVSTVTAAHILEAQTKPGPTGAPPPNGEEARLSFETFPATALAKTYNVDLQTGESAGAMTAIMTGLKTNGAAVAVDASQKPTECKLAAPPAKGKAPTPASLQGQLPTLLEQAKEAGLSAGLVTTGRVTQSVPAATYAHANDRDWETDAEMLDGLAALGCRDIARQLVEFDHHGPLDVVLGGGRLAFLPATLDDAEGQPAGVRKDGRNLVETWLLNPKGRYVANKRQFETVNWKTERPVLGLFAPDRLTFTDDARTAQRPGGEPTLTDMTRAAITLLRQNRRGYILVVDAGGIGAGHQAGNAHRALTETVELSNAVRAAQTMTSPRNTLIMVTAEQGSPMTIAGYPKRGNPILGLAPGEDALGRPYTTLTYANGPGGYPGPPVDTASVSDVLPPSPPPLAGVGGSQQLVDGRPLLMETSQWRASPRPLLTEQVARDVDYVQAAAIPLTTTTHSGEDVPVYAVGPGSQAVHGVMEQNDLYWVMRASLPPVSRVAKAAAVPPKTQKAVGS